MKAVIKKYLDELDEGLFITNSSLNALVEILINKGLISQKEFDEKVREIEDESIIEDEDDFEDDDNDEDISEDVNEDDINEEYEKVEEEKSVKNDKNKNNENKNKKSSKSDKKATSSINTKGKN